MFKILVADDEYLERKALSIILGEKSGIDDIEIVGEAGDGNEVVKLAKEKNPDIIFMDVKMPGMDGLKAIKLIKENLDHTKFVILTAYDEFEYVQEALSLGIEEYLLKPVKPQKVRKLVRKLINKIQSSKKDEKIRKQMREKLNMVMPYIKMSFVFDLVFLNIDTIEEIKSRTEFFDIEELPSAVMIADIDQFARSTVNEDELKRQLHKKEVFSVIKNFEKKYKSLMVVPMSSDEIIILYFGEEIYKNERIKKWLKKVAKEISQEVKNKTEFTITIGIGSYYNDPRLVDRSYHEALGAIRNSLLVGEGSAVHWEDIKNRDFHEIAYPYDIESRLVEKFKSRKVNHLSELVDTLFNSWQIDESFNSILVKSRMMELLGVLSRSAVEVGANFKDISPLNYKFTQELFKVNNQEQMKNWLNTVLIKLSEKIDNFGADFKEKIIYNGVKYVQSNYTEDITLTEAAEAASLSTHYFSRIFKKEMGCTFKSYLTQLRIEEAKRRLNKKNVNIAIIAKEIGYNDPSYFSKVFKKYEGVSPSEYRN